MTRYATNSWQARRALAFREPYTTGGAMRAVEGTTSTGRLNDHWTSTYRADMPRIVYTVMSYSTPIAWVLDDNSVVKVDQKFSITTSGHQGMLYALDATGENRADLDERADAERQRNRDRAATRREERHPAVLLGHPVLPREGRSLNAALSQDIVNSLMASVEEQVAQERQRVVAERARAERSQSTYPPPKPLNVAPIRMEYSETFSHEKGWAAPKDWGGDSPARANER